MASFNIEGVNQGLEKAHRDIEDKAEDVQTTVDDPNRNEQDLYSDVVEFQQMFNQKQIGERIMLAAAGANFKIGDQIVQEVK